MSALSRYVISLANCSISMRRPCYVIKKIKESAKLRGLCFAMARYLNNIDIRSNFLLCCMPRGGSTWLTQILHNTTKLPVLWEPLHPERVPELKRLNLSSEQLVPEDERWDELESFFESMFRGRILNPWCCEMSHPAKFLGAQGMIIKFCRVNGMLPWLTKRFEFKKKPILLLRHPFSVVASQLKHPGFRDIEAKFTITDTRYSEIAHRHKEIMEFVSSVAERQVFVWCMVNCMPLKSDRHNKDWITVFYEDLLERPDAELRRIGAEWGLKIGGIDLETVYKPSRTTVGTKDFRNATQQLASWQNRFSDAEIRRMQHILEYFEIEEYDTSIRPIKGASYA